MNYQFPFKFGGKVIELGGGDNPQYRPNYDTRQLPNVDITIDFNNDLPIPDEDCDGIYCRYCLEHLSWRRIKNFLSEIFRILKPDGVAIFITANLLEQSKVLVNNSEWNEKMVSMIFGDQNFQDDQWDSNAHHSGFSPEYIDRVLRGIGFGNIKIIPIQTEVGSTDMIVEVHKHNTEKKEIDSTTVNPTAETGKNINRGTAHQFNRAYFDGEAYTGIGFQDFPVHYNTVAFIKKRNPKSVIDIGGARGYIVKRLNDQGTPSTCIDISEHCFHTRATDRFILHDLTNIPWPIKDKEFDLSVSVSSLEHIPEDKIDSVIKEIARISQRGLHGITFEITSQDVDKTHLLGTMKSKEWWISKFKDIVPDYPVEIFDKEEIEANPVIIPCSADNLVKLNVGSFINMYHEWINIDKIDLSGFAKQNGYTFRQEDVSNSIPYENNSVDLIVASHFLEHLDRNEGKKFLSECLRVLKPKGVIRLTVPDTELITKKYIDKSISECRHFNVGVEKSDDDTYSLYELLLSGHKTIYDYDSLSKLLSKVGFDNIQRMGFNKSNSKEIETQTIDMFPTLSLYVEATPALVYNDNVIQNTGRDITNNDMSKNWNILTAGKAEQIQNTYNSDRKLRIGIISTPFFTVPPSGYSGLEMVVWDLACGLDELGHDVTIFAPEGSQPTAHGHLVTTGKSVNTVNIDWFLAEKNAYEKYKDLITPDKYDVIHDHTWFAFPYLLKGKYPNLKIIHTQHGGFSWSSPPNW